MSISCKKATELISQAREERLSIQEKFQLFLHLRICSFCRFFKEQLGLIAEQSKKEQEIEQKSPEGMKERIKKKLQI